MREAVVVTAVRTPVGSIGGALKNIPAEELLKIAINGAIDKSGLDKNSIDEVIMGQAKQSTDAPNVARVAALMAGIPVEIPSYTVHRQCASGMQAMWNAVQQIRGGLANVIIAGGVESMSTAPFYLRQARFGVGNGNTVLVDPNTESQPRSQPRDIFGEFNMIQTADTVARQYQVSREEQDEFALTSQIRAIQAIDSGRFDDEIIPVPLPQRKGPPLSFCTDEHPKRQTDLEKLSKLKPIFQDGFVTAGNASGRNDGAAAVVIMDKEYALAQGFVPMAKIVAATAVGVDPRVMGIAPVPAIGKLLATTGMALADFDLLEINEAFAAQAVACANQLGVNRDLLNVNGGAIALGHPLGCSGARISTTLLHEMKKRGAGYGLASLCVAGGLGMAMSFENI